MTKRISIYIWLMAIITIAGCRNAEGNQSCNGNGCNCQATTTVASPSGSCANDVDNVRSDEESDQSATGTFKSQSASGLLQVAGAKVETILNRKSYTTSYNSETRQPNWVAWNLTSEHTGGELKFRSFHEDESVAEPRATLEDYKNSGWSRGHMCPAGDNKWDVAAREQTFLLTNICPQNGELNGGTWNQIEMRCREWAKRYDEVSIVCGPIFYSDRFRTIGLNKVAVPDAFFKVVARENSSGDISVIGFICPNRGGTGKMAQYTASIVEIEQQTGLSFSVSSGTMREVPLSDW